MSKAFLYLGFLLLVGFSCKETKPSPPAEDEVTTNSDSSDVENSDTIKAGEAIVFNPDYDTTQWQEPVRLDSSIVLDMRYATTNNFVQEQLYECGRCFLRPEAAKALIKVNQILSEKGYRLKMFDCFRPLPVQQKLWDKFQDPSYVTPPSKGSMHNRGLAVDLTIVDASGNELDMGTEFDFFGPEAHHTYQGHSAEVNQNRALLKSTMESVGFKGIRTEWWHYSYGKKSYTLSEMVWKCPE